MRIDTRIFGTVDIAEDRIINFPSGIVGFPDLKQFAIIHDEEKGPNAIRWMQSVQEPNFAMPVMDPLLVLAEYNPVVDDELLKNIGTLTEDNTLVLVTVTVPSDITKMTVNLQAPFVINADEKKAAQIIVDTDKYPVRFPIYDVLKKMKEEA